MDLNSFPWMYELIVIDTVNGWRKTSSYDNEEKARKNYWLVNDAVGCIAILSQSRLSVVKGVPGL